MGMPTAKKCEHCTSDVYFETWEGYNNHIKIAHPNKPFKGDAYRCDECGNKYFDSCNELNDHKRTTHP